MSMRSVWIEKILKNPSGPQLMVLNQILKFVIPFNAPHGFRILELSDSQVKIHLPFTKKNLNHLHGIHACAITTAGEMAAGMALISSFPISKYRPILSKLSCEYLYQGKTDLIATIQVAADQIPNVKKEIEMQGKAIVDFETLVVDQNKNLVAKVYTTWQIKSWEQVKTKS